MKITVKIFKSNVWSFLPCFLSSILVTAALFLFVGIKDMFLNAMSDEEILTSSLGISAHLYIYVLLFIGVMLILYTVNNYSRKRIRDYGTFMVLGAGKGSIIRMILMEYGLISMFSYIIGSVFGTAFLFFVRRLILAEKIRMDLDLRMYAGIVLKTFCYMLMVYAAAVFMNVVYLQGNSLSSLMRYDRKKGRRPSIKESIAGTFCSAVCFAAAYVVLASKNTVPYVKMKYGLFIVLSGLFLCFTYFGSLLLYLLGRRERWYFKHLLRIKNMYYRFADNKNIMLLSFVINFVVLVFINMNIVEFGDTDSRYLWKYPFDYVYAVEEGQTESLLLEIKPEGKEVDVYPCIFITSLEEGEYIGMPASAFWKLAGKEEELRPGEVIGILQKDKEDEDILLPSGRVCLETAGQAEWFTAKTQMNQILFVANQRESIGVLILNDTDYDAMRRMWGSMSLVTQRVEEYSVQSEEYLKDTAQSFDAALFYSKEELMLEDRKEDMMSLTFYICMGIFLIIGNMTVLAVKVWSEIPILRGKYSFLGRLGMDDREIKSNIKGELSICMKIPFVLSIAAGTLVLIGILGVENILETEKIILLFIALIFTQGCFIAGMTGYGYHLVRNRLDKREVMIWN